MPRLIVRLPDDRDWTGSLTLESDDERIIAGPYAVCGRADDRTATRHGNPERSPLLPFGDTPLGLYRLVQVLDSGSGTHLPSDAFGPHGVAVLEPLNGDAALADANGRFQLLIQGGILGPGGALRSTYGGLRLTDRDQRELVRLLRQSGPVLCSCLKDIPSRSLHRVATNVACGESDPISALSSRSRQVVSLLRSTANETDQQLMPDQGNRRRRFAPRTAFRALFSPGGGGGGGGGGFGDSGYGGEGNSGEGSPSGSSGQPAEPGAGPYTPASGPYIPSSDVSPYTPSSGGFYSPASGDSYSPGAVAGPSDLYQSLPNESYTFDTYQSAPNQSSFQSSALNEGTVTQSYPTDEKLFSSLDEKNSSLYSSPENDGITRDDSDPKSPLPRDDRTARLSASGAELAEGVAGGVKSAFGISSTGLPDAPLTLYSNTPGEKDFSPLAAEASNKVPPEGYMIKDTQYYDVGVKAESELAPGFTQADYNQAWSGPSKSAVNDAMYSGRGVNTVNNLNDPSDPVYATKPNVQGVAGDEVPSIQLETELPAVRNAGGIAGGLNIAGGVLLIANAVSDDSAPTPLRGAELVAGAGQVGGGATVIAGAASVDASLVAAGTRIAGAAGGAGVAIISGYNAYQDFQSGNTTAGIYDTIGAVGGVLLTGAALAGPGAPLVAGAGAVLSMAPVVYNVYQNWPSITNAAYQFFVGSN